MRKTRLVLPVVLLAATAACTAPDARDAGLQATPDSAVRAMPPDGRLRGIITFAATGPVLVACGARDTLRLSDAGSTLAVVPRDARTGGAFVVVTARRTESEALEVERVHYASNERQECFTDWSGFDYRATGSSPGWVAEVKGSRITLRNQGDEETTWTGAQVDSGTNTIRISAPPAAGRSFELVLRPASCMNRVSGAYSGWSAVLTTGEKAFSGCAVPGVR